MHRSFPVYHKVYREGGEEYRTDFPVGLSKFVRLLLIQQGENFLAHFIKVLVNVYGVLPFNFHNLSVVTSKRRVEEGKLFVGQ